MQFEKETTALTKSLNNNPKITRILLVALGGSHAYGLATKASDVDLRGFALPTARDILLGRDFEQVLTSNDSDTCIYSLSKACKLMAQCNPNMIELIGLDDESVLVSSPEYQEITSHPEWFLSRQAARTFGGYAIAQLRRLQNAMARDEDAARQTAGAMRSMQAALDALPKRYPSLANRALFSLRPNNDEDTPEIEISIHADKVRATELASFARELDSARKSAETIGKNKRRESSKLAKHASHLIRLLHMGSEILEGQGVQTRRTDDAELLLDLKKGMWLDESDDGRRTYDDAFWDLLSESQKRFDTAEKETALPDDPDTDAINEFVAESHALVVDAYKTR